MSSAAPGMAMSRPLGLKPQGLRQAPRRAWGRPDHAPAALPTAPAAPVYGESGTTRFKGRPVRYLPVNAVPWFALPDLQEATGFGDWTLDAVNGPDFPAHAKMVCGELADLEVPGEPEDVVLLSPTGVWEWTVVTDPGKGQAVAAWAKQEAARQCPSPLPGDRAVFLSLRDDGELPPYPFRFSGRKSEWIDLRWSDAYLMAGPVRYGGLSAGEPPAN